MTSSNVSKKSFVPGCRNDHRRKYSRWARVKARAPRSFLSWAMKRPTFMYELMP